MFKHVTSFVKATSRFEILECFELYLVYKNNFIYCVNLLFQITGLPLSRLKENRRCTARFLNSVVKPRRLREMVKAESHLCR